jgi:hypothetical protein
METALHFSVPFMHGERRSVSGILKETMKRIGVLGIEPGQLAGKGAVPQGNLLFDAEIMKYVSLQSPLGRHLNKQISPCFQPRPKSKGILIAKANPVASAFRISKGWVNQPILFH